MQIPTSSRVKWNIIFFLIAFLVVVIDRLSKIWVINNLAPGESIPHTGFFRLTHAQNTGAAFSLFYGRTSALSVISIIGVILILVYVFVIYRRFPFLDTRLNKSALGLILGGTIGNLIDRIYYGYVTDFIDVGPWPVFNVADSATVVGVIIFAISIFFATRADSTHHE